MTGSAVKDRAYFEKQAMRFRALTEVLPYGPQRIDAMNHAEDCEAAADALRELEDVILTLTRLSEWLDRADWG